MRLSKSLGKFPDQDTQKYTGIKYQQQAEPALVINHVPCDERVWNLKNRIKYRTGIETFFQILEYRAQALDSSYTLAKYRILSDTTLTLIDITPRRFYSKRKRGPSPTEGNSKANSACQSFISPGGGGSEPQVISFTVG